MNLSPNTLANIDIVILKYPYKRSATLPLLHLIQEDQGYISKEAIEWIASKLDIQAINVYELVTFYPMLRQDPVGKKHIKICRTLSCALAGSYKLCKVLEKKLNCPLNETSKDGNFTINFVECIASCNLAPVIQVGEVLYPNITPEKAADFAEQLCREVSTAI